MYEGKLFTVYSLYNPFSEKYYIGITSKNPNERWKNGKGYSHNPHLTNAINKYGWDSFEKTIIANNLSFEIASRFEQRLIKECDSYINGYNQSWGGENSPSFNMSQEARRKISEYQKTIYGDKCWNYGVSIREQLGDKYEQWLNNVRAARQLPTSRWRKVICLNDNKIYDSCEKACQAYDLTTINTICLGKCGTDKYDPKGYELKFDFYEEGKEYTFKDYNIRHSKNCVICLNTGEIFARPSEAARVLNCDLSSLLKHLKGKFKHTHGYQFKYYKDYISPN